MAKARRFQLVIQLPDDFFPTFDEMVAFEDRLIASMPKTCDVDGHDIGSGTINFFVYTSAPDAAFRTFRKYLGTNAVERWLRIAYRSTNGATFTNLWPRRDPRPFDYWYEPDQNPFARGAKRLIPKRSPPKKKTTTAITLEKSSSKKRSPTKKGASTKRSAKKRSVSKRRSSTKNRSAPKT